MKHSSSTWPALVAGIGVALAASGGEDRVASIAQVQPVKAPLVASQPGSARRSIDRFTAVTAGMTPKDVTLRFSVLEWSDQARRADVVAALASPDPMGALLRLPTLGYVWLSSSPAGLAVKYAVRTIAPDGGERITFVTEKRLDYYDYKKWVPAPPLAAKDTAYGVIELYLDPTGHGTGTLSLAADVKVDAGTSEVSLAAGAPRLLTNVQAEREASKELAKASSAG